MSDKECDKECDKEYLQLHQHHRYLFCSSHASLICAIYGMNNNNNMLWLIPAGVYINSVNYWRNPVRGMRRNLDIGWVGVGLVINSTCASCYSTNAIYYYGPTLFACLMYFFGYYFYWRKQYVIATFIHSLIHLFGNIGNVYLYIGLGDK